MAEFFRTFIYMSTILMYEHTMTPSQIVMLIFAGGVTILAYVFRKIPVVGRAWFVIKIFWIVVIGTLLANFLKKEIKEWWNK